MSRAKRPTYFRSLSSYTQKDKPRLYIALYPRGGSDVSPSSHAYCDAHHWALIIGPSTASRKDDAMRYHLSHSSSGFESRSGGAHAFCYEEDNLSDSPTARGVLVRIAVAKVVDVDQANKILRSLYPRREDESYTCFTWVQEAFAALHADTGCLKSYFDVDDWKSVERCAREYCRRKRQERRFVDDATLQDSSDISTFNVWENRETTA